MTVEAMPVCMVECGVQCTLPNPDVPTVRKGHRPSLTGVLSHRLSFSGSLPMPDSLVAPVAEEETEGNDEEELEKVLGWIRELVIWLPHIRRRVVAIHAKKENPERTKPILDQIVKIMRAVGGSSSHERFASSPASHETIEEGKKELGSWTATKSEPKAVSLTEALKEEQRRRPLDGEKYASSPAQGRTFSRSSSADSLSSFNFGTQSASTSRHNRWSSEMSVDAENGPSAPSEPRPPSTLARSFRKSIGFKPGESSTELGQSPTSPTSGTLDNGKPKILNGEAGTDVEDFLGTKVQAEDPSLRDRVSNRAHSAPASDQQTPPKPPPISVPSPSVGNSSVEGTILPMLVQEEEVEGQAEFTHCLSMVSGSPQHGKRGSSKQAHLPPTKPAPISPRRPSSFLSRVLPSWSADH